MKTRRQYINRLLDYRLIVRSGIKAAVRELDRLNKRITLLEAREEHDRIFKTKRLNQNLKDRLFNYQLFTKTTAMDFEPNSSTCLAKYALGIGGEFGEVKEKVKKYLRGDFSNSEFRKIITPELGDVYWYLGINHSLYGIILECDSVRPNNDVGASSNLDIALKTLKLDRLSGTLSGAIHDYLKDKNEVNLDTLLAVLREFTTEFTNFVFALTISPFEVLDLNEKKLKSRLARNKIQGSGDNR